jgi:hypothetical protein
LVASHSYVLGRSYDHQARIGSDSGMLAGGTMSTGAPASSASLLFIT